MNLNGTEINLSESFNQSALQYMPKEEQATASLEQGFITGAQHVHDAVGILLVTYMIELGVWGVAHFWADKFKSEEMASEFYIRVRRMLVSGRVTILLALFFKTAFTFVTGSGAY